ncbi:MAG: ThiF family adenylyltransferase [Bryobacterales bacterium]|nr:ThiF family adenylyltransferase [Bryobacteraceae bacterium]MDW8352934.1 ThiF family adenylyltransferase [Bryobacterales bacterium]
MTPGHTDRYSRQILFAGLGEEGQQRLMESCAVIVGCGALGNFQADALARAGVGRIRLIDRDYVEWSNLQRQCLFEEADAEQALPKAVAAARRLQRVNSQIQLAPVVADLTPENAEELLGGAGVVLDGTDNFETRYLVNDFCVSRGIPWIYGGAVGSYGIAMPVLPGETPCLKCLYPSPPAADQPTCETAGVLNVVPQLVAAVQTAEALKILAGRGRAVSRRITTVDLWTGVLRQIELPARDPQCLACGRRSFLHLEGSGRAPISLCGRNAVQIHERTRPIDLTALAGRLSRLGQVRHNEFAVRFVTPPYELMIFSDGRAIIKGTTDPALARSLYARYVGS